MIPYILYTALILSACLLFYKLLLQRETFFHLNRFVLLSCMVLAFVLPLVPVPQELSLRKEIGVQHSTETKIAVNKNAHLKTPAVQEVFFEKTKNAINVDLLMQWLVYFYWFGVVVFGLNFLMQAAVLLFKAYSTASIQDGKFRIVEITGDKAPCSFGNNIFINPEKYEWETYNQILLHEKIHIEQKHTIDLLLAELVLIFQWFNPFAWQWRIALERNLEFFTDDKMLQQDTVEKESYQFSLLKVAAPHFPLSLTTNYNQSLIKKRIIMMNSKKSNVHTTWKYFFLLPLLVLFVCLFNQPVALGQNLNKEEESKESAVNSNIQNDLETEGNWSAIIKDNVVNIQFINKEQSNTSTATFQLSEFNNLQKNNQGSFTLTREAGIINFEGKFEGNNGMGTYKFTSNKNFTAALQQEGITVANESDLMALFIVNVKTSYVKMLKKNGYKDLNKDQLIPLAALDANLEYINDIKKSGISNFDLDDLIAFKSMGIDRIFIDEVRQAGYKNITVDNIIAFKSQGIDGKYIADFNKSTIENDADETGDNIIAFKSMNIDKEFIDSYKELGYNTLSIDDLIALKSMNITPKYINDFEKSGFKKINIDDLIALKSQNITPDLITEYTNLGLTDLNIDDIIGAKSMGISPPFIKTMKEKGHTFKTLEKYMEFKSIVGIK